MNSRVTGIGFLAAVVLILTGLTVGSTLTFARAGHQDIVDTAAGAGQFTTLVKALKAADLVGTLKEPGPFTVFAPTDAAFAKLPAGTLDDLLKPENKAKLAAILTYHVVPGSVILKHMAKMHEVKTVNGAMLKVGGMHGRLMVNDAMVQNRVMASNGIIYVIDKVLMPPEE